MRLQRIHEIVFHRPWLITPSAHDSIRALLDRKLTHSVIEREQAGFLDDLMTTRPGPSVEDGVGHVYISGTIGIGLSKLEKACGNTDTRDLLAELRKVQEQGAERIMIHVDSPGGMVGGTPEAAAEIAEIAVPIFAYIEPGGMACSAAYYLIAGVDRIYGSSTSEAGSIGVYLPWVDQSARYAAAGLQVDLIKNKEGDLKGAGFPGTSLTEAQRADLQEGVQQIFDDFAAFVRANRPAPMNADTFRGQSFSGADAKNRKLLDGVTSYAAALRSLQRFKRPL